MGLGGEGRVSPGRGRDVRVEMDTAPNTDRRYSRHLACTRHWCVSVMSLFFFFGGVGGGVFVSRPLSI